MKNFRALQLPLYKIGVPYYQKWYCCAAIRVGEARERNFLPSRHRRIFLLKFKRKHFSEMSDAIFYYQKKSICSLRRIYLHIFHAPPLLLETFVPHYYWGVKSECLYGNEMTMKKKFFAPPHQLLHIFKWGSRREGNVLKRFNS